MGLIFGRLWDATEVAFFWMAMVFIWGLMAFAVSVPVILLTNAVTVAMQDRDAKMQGVISWADGR